MTSPVVHLGALPQDIARMIVRIIGVDHRPFLRKGPGIAFRLKVREESSHRTEKATLENKRLVSALHLPSHFFCRCKFVIGFIRSRQRGTMQFSGI